MILSTSSLAQFAIRAISRLLCVPMAIALGAGASSPPEIDFRTVESSEPAINFLGGTGSAGSAGGTGIAKVRNLAIMIVSLSSNCNESDPYASLRLLNKGLSALTLPWSPDGARVVEAKDRDQITFDTLSVTIRGRHKPQIFVTRTLFGNRGVAESRLTLPAGGSTLLRNISLKTHEGSVCGTALAAEVALTSNQALKEGPGYSLHSQERWRIESQ